MDLKILILYGFLGSQGAWSLPASTSFGTQLSNSFKSNLGSFMNNIQSGVGNIVTQPIKLGVDVIPSLVTNGTKTAAEKVSKLADTNKEAVGKVSVGIGHALGGAGVLGSSILGGALQVAGSGLGAINGVVGAGAQAGLDLTGQLKNTSSVGQTLMDNIGNNILNGVEGGMTAIGNGAGVVSSGISSAIDTLGGQITQGITTAEQRASTLMDSGANAVGTSIQNMASSAQLAHYNALKTFLDLLTNVQAVFDLLYKSINAIGTSSESSNSTTSSS